MRDLFSVTTCWRKGQASVTWQVGTLSPHLLGGDRVGARSHHVYCYLTNVPLQAWHFLAGNYDRRIIFDTYHNLLGR